MCMNVHVTHEWCGTYRYGVHVTCGVVWCGVVRCGAVQCDAVWYLPVV